MADDSSRPLDSLSDRDLLRLFVQSGDEAAFRQLVDRHAALVLGTCRRGLHCSADAEDAFQATFLVLARSAGKIRRRESLGSWLYGVATRVCLKMRRDAARRNTQELMDAAAPEVDPLDELLARHDETVADEELNALPETLRTPMVLRYLAGKSNTQVADELGITIAALEGRLKRGKQRLRLRLVRRGVALGAVVATLKATRVVASEIPANLTESAVELCSSGATATIASLASESTTSTHFALQELNAMNATLLSKPVVAALAVSGLAAAVITSQAAFSQGEAEAGDPFALNTIAEADDPFGDANVATNVVSQNDQVDPFASVDALSDDRPAEEPAQDSSENSASGEELSFTRTRIVDLKQRSDSEKAIEEALATPLNSGGLDFQDAPLEEVVDFLRTEYEMEMQIDERSLDELGLSPDDPVNVNLRNISVEAALNILLRPMDLTYIIDNEVLLIVSEEEAATRFEVRAYPADILGVDSSVLEELLIETVSPESWSVKHGEGAISSALGDRLIIRQTYAVHREINQLLSQLRNRSSLDQNSFRPFRDAEMGIMDAPRVKNAPRR